MGSEWSESVAESLEIGDPAGYRILIGNDIPAPLASDPGYQAVIVFHSADPTTYHYLALFGDLVTQRMEMGRVTAGVQTITTWVDDAGSIRDLTDYAWTPSSANPLRTFSRNPGVLTESHDMLIDGRSEARGILDGADEDDISTLASTTNTEVLVTGMSVDTTNAPQGLLSERRYHLRARVHGLSTVAGDVILFRVRKSNLLGAQIGTASLWVPRANLRADKEILVRYVPVVDESPTFVLTASRSAGTGTITVQDFGSADPCYMWIEDVTSSATFRAV